MEGKGGCVHLETGWRGNHASCFSALSCLALVSPEHGHWEGAPSSAYKLDTDGVDGVGFPPAS